jgi:hypothetical protein
MATKPPIFAVGDPVAYSVQFLRSTAQQHTPMAHARGVVVGLQAMGETTLVEIDWKTDAIPSKVNAANLAHVGPNPRFCQCD